jgi:hypothetical protein
VKKHGGNLLCYDRGMIALAIILVCCVLAVAVAVVPPARGGSSSYRMPRSDDDDGGTNPLALMQASKVLGHDVGGFSGDGFRDDPL